MDIMLFLDLMHRNAMIFAIAALIVLFFAVPLWVAVRLRRRWPPPEEEAPAAQGAQRRDGLQRDLLWLVAIALELLQAFILVVTLAELFEKIVKLAN